MIAVAVVRTAILRPENLRFSEVIFHVMAGSVPAMIVIGHEKRPGIRARPVGEKREVMRLASALLVGLGRSGGSAFVVRTFVLHTRRALTIVVAAAPVVMSLTAWTPAARSPTMAAVAHSKAG